MSYTRTATVDMPHDRALEVVRGALAEQGFGVLAEGVLTEIDMTATLQAVRHASA